MTDEVLHRSGGASLHRLFLRDTISSCVWGVAEASISRAAWSRRPPPSAGTHLGDGPYS
jgi:hypothetical protein